MRGIGVLAIIAGLAVSGCSETYWTSNVRESMSLNTSSAIATNADVRLVHRFRGQETVVRRTPAGNVTETVPREYLCAEPSPDVARAVQAALSGSASAAGSGAPSGAGTAIEAQIAAQWNASRSESLAQLTKRIPTIQLLRDNLYRACEAYANGAIGPDMYAAMLSRFDRMMITMLMGEMAAGHFGSAAILTGNAAASAAGEASAGPGGRAAVAEAQYQSAKNDYVAQVKHVEELRVQKTQADKRLATKQAASTDFAAEQQEVNALEVKIAAEEKLETQAKADMDAAKSARDAAQAEAKGARGVAAVRGQSSTSAGGFFESPVAATADAARATAEVLARMQRSYLNDPPLHSMMMMCFSELARPEPVGEELRRQCVHMFQTMMSAQGQQLVRDSSIGPQRAEIENDRIAALGRALQGLVAAGTLTPAQASRELQRAGAAQPPRPAAPAAPPTGRAAETPPTR